MNSEAHLNFLMPGVLLVVLALILSLTLWELPGFGGRLTQEEERQ